MEGDVPAKTFSEVPRLFSSFGTKTSVQVLPKSIKSTITSLCKWPSWSWRDFFRIFDNLGMVNSAILVSEWTFGAKGFWKFSRFIQLFWALKEMIRAGLWEVPEEKSAGDAAIIGRTPQKKNLKIERFFRLLTYFMTENSNMHSGCHDNLLGQSFCVAGCRRCLLQDEDHSGSRPHSFPGFPRLCSGMFPERFRNASVSVGSKEIRLI